MKAFRRMVLGFVIGLALLLMGPVLTMAFGPVSFKGNWSTASHRPTGRAPDPATHPEAIVQVYASRTFGWRGAFAVHTWLAAKPAGADRYDRYEVIGWNLRYGHTAVSISDARAPDAEWFGSPPIVVREVRGSDAEAVIAKLTGRGVVPLSGHVQRVAGSEQQHLHRPPRS